MGYNPLYRDIAKAMGGRVVLGLTSPSDDVVFFANGLRVSMEEFAMSRSRTEYQRLSAEIRAQVERELEEDQREKLRQMLASRLGGLYSGGTYIQRPIIYATSEAEAPPTPAKAPEPAQPKPLSIKPTGRLIEI